MTIRRELIAAADKVIDSEAGWGTGEIVDAVLNGLIDRMDTIGFQGFRVSDGLSANQLRDIRDGML